MALSNEDREEIGNTIRLVVNGNIKRVEEKLDQHIEDHDKLFDSYAQLNVQLQPVVAAVAWINTTRTFVLWCAGIAAAVISLASLSKLTQ